MAFDGSRGDPRPRKRPMVFGIIPRREPPPRPTITLLTDFGASDIYAGVMKGVIKRLAPHADVIDLTHEVAPQDVVQGAFLLQQARRHFPPGTVHLAVVDPGVGTARRRLALQSEGHYFVGPDNGLLSCALPDEARGQRPTGEPYVALDINLPSGVRAFAGEGGASPGVSATFEGRDVFAPAAAFLARGGDIAGIGRPVETLLAFPAFRGRLEHGVVLHVDRYGNLITDVRGEDIAPGMQLEVAGRRLALVRTYGNASDLCALTGSGGYVEIALPNGSAAAKLGLGKGASVRVLTS